MIAGGAKQGIDPRVSSEWFPYVPQEIIIPSDSFLKKWVYTEQVARLRKIQTDGKKRVKVVIIGGSHSGFSCAWLLLNGPATYQHCLKQL